MGQPTGMKLRLIDRVLDFLARNAELTDAARDHLHGIAIVCSGGKRNLG